MCDFLPNLPSKCKWNKNSEPDSSPHRKQEWRNNLVVMPDILSFIGNTPLIKLNKIPQTVGLKCDVYVKCEYLNPGGSLTDRVALRAIEDAETSGQLKPGMTLVEPAPGSAGVGFALTCAVKGYNCIIVMPEKTSPEKEAIINALGGVVVRTPGNKKSDDPEGLFAVAKKLLEETENAVCLNQFTNQSNPLVHYDTTAEEILDALDDEVDMIVIGAGTGGTITGIGRKFKEKNPDILVVAADPEGSILAQPDYLNRTDVTSYEVEGIGYDFIPTVLDRTVVDQWVKTNDKMATSLARRLIKEEGILCGASSGAALQAAISAGVKLEEGKKLVIIIPDGVTNYLSKFMNDQWMEERRFKPCVNLNEHWWWDINLSALATATPETAYSTSSCHRVLHIMKKKKVHQVPVLDKNGSLCGVVTMQNLINGLISGKIQPSDEIENVMSRTFPKVFKTGNLGIVSRILENERYVVIVQRSYCGGVCKEKPLGIITGMDLLQYIVNSPENMQCNPKSNCI